MRENTEGKLASKSAVVVGLAAIATWSLLVGASKAVARPRPWSPTEVTIGVIGIERFSQYQFFARVDQTTSLDDLLAGKHSWRYLRVTSGASFKSLEELFAWRADRSGAYVGVVAGIMRTKYQGMVLPYASSVRQTYRIKAVTDAGIEVALVSEERFEEGERVAKLTLAEVAAELQADDAQEGRQELDERERIARNEERSDSGPGSSALPSAEGAQPSTLSQASTPARTGSLWRVLAVAGALAVAGLAAPRAWRKWRK